MKVQKLIGGGKRDFLTNGVRTNRYLLDIHSQKKKKERKKINLNLNLMPYKKKLTQNELQI